MSFTYELPIPHVDEKQKSLIAEKAYQLLCHKSAPGLFDELGKALGIKSQKTFDEIQTRAEIEVLIARDLYGLTKEDWEYLTSTFVYGDESDSKKELDEIISRSLKLF